MTDSIFPSSDVRMRGFAERALVETALDWVDCNSTRLDSECVAIHDASGRVLAGDVVSPIDVPGFDRAAMDGYALRGHETTGAGDYNLLSFGIVGESMPGRAYEGCVAAGQAVRIMTGAPMPEGADAVVPAEFATESNSCVEISTSVSPGKHVGRCGEDLRVGSLALPDGRKLRPQDLGLLASIGIAQVEVVRRPRARLLVTGNELAEPGEARAPYQIYESNSSMLAALVGRDGGVLVERLRVSDDRNSVRQSMLAPGVDVVLVSGGSSVGREDFAPSILAAEGELAIHGIAMRPSSPAGMGRLGNSLVFLLPGNPVSCLCAYDFFAGRAVRLLGGRSATWPYPPIRATVKKKIVSAVGRVDYCRVALIGEELEPIATSGAGILSSTTRADGFVIVPAESEGYAPGTVVTAYLYDELPAPSPVGRGSG